MSLIVIVFAVLFLGAAATAYAFYLQSSALRAKDGERQRDAEEARTNGQKAQKELESARDELNRRKGELADAREKLNEVRTRTFKQREQEKKQRGGSEADLQDRLGSAERDLDEERARVDVLSRETKGMQDEIARLRETHKRLEESLKGAQVAATRAAAQPVQATTAPAADAVAAPAVPKSDDQLKARVESIEKQLRETRRKAAEADEELKRARSKASTASRQALLTRSELDLFREKLVWSEKRVVELERLLFDNKIALPDREAAPQPNLQLAPAIIARESGTTGGEGIVADAADYVPEQQAAESTPAPEATPAPAVPAPAEAVAPAAAPIAQEAEAEEGAAGSGGVAPVPPLRRPRAVVESRVDEGAAKVE